MNKDTSANKNKVHYKVEENFKKDPIKSENSSEYEAEEDEQSP